MKTQPTRKPPFNWRAIFAASALVVLGYVGGNAALVGSGVSGLATELVSSQSVGD